MLTERSQEKELLDLGSRFYTEEEYEDCLAKLFLVGKLFGINRDTRKAIEALSPEPKTAVDVGCGGGGLLLYLAKYFPSMQMMGIDISEKAISYANKDKVYSVTFELQKEPKLTLPENSVDVVLATLVCHHMTDEELVDFLKSAYTAARSVVIINDLQRHCLSRWLFAIIAPLLFRNRLITHDGLISIKRGFTRSEWQHLLEKAGCSKYSLSWKFPFRWQVCLWKRS